MESHSPESTSLITKGGRSQELHRRLREMLQASGRENLFIGNVEVTIDDVRSPEEFRAWFQRVVIGARDAWQSKMGRAASCSREWHADLIMRGPTTSIGKLMRNTSEEVFDMVKLLGDRDAITVKRKNGADDESVTYSAADLLERWMRMRPAVRDRITAALKEGGQ